MSIISVLTKLYLVCILLVVIEILEETMQALAGFVVGYFLVSLVIALVGGIELSNLGKHEKISKDAFPQFMLFSIFWLPATIYLVYKDWLRS